MEFLRQIKSDFDYKLLVLLALDSVDCITKYELNSLLIEGEYADYFSTNIALEDLLTQKSVILMDIYYCITDKGKTELRMFSNRIPQSIKTRFLINAIQYKNDILKSRSIDVGFNNLDNNMAKIILYAYDNRYEILKIHCTTLANNINFDCKKKLKKSYKNVYKSLLSIAFVNMKTNKKVKGFTSSEVEYIQNLPYVIMNYKNENISWHIKLLTPSPDIMEKCSNAWKFFAEVKLEEIKKYFLIK